MQRLPLASGCESMVNESLTRVSIRGVYDYYGSVKIEVDERQIIRCMIHEHKALFLITNISNILSSPQQNDLAPSFGGDQ